MTRSSILSRTLVAALALWGGAAPARAEDAPEYWTDYAIYPQACINYNGVDRVMYSMFAQSSNHCTDAPLGIYVAAAADFADAYLEQAADNAADAGQDDWAYPSAADYLGCTYEQVNGKDRYLQLGCSGDGSSRLAVTAYKDAACTERDDNIDADDLPGDLSVSFRKCTPCVHWMDKNDDEIDDQYYELKQTTAPFCSAMWMYREECSGQCLVMAQETGESGEGWNKADKVLLTFLSLFGFSMLLAIVKKRQSMSNKDALMEQAAISAAGLQPSHILGSFALLILIAVMFALLGLKKITWGLLLLLNIILFAYLMKLTVDGSVKETIIVDGKIVEKDDSDDEEEDGGTVSPDSAAAGDYKSPDLPQLS